MKGNKVKYILSLLLVIMIITVMPEGAFAEGKVTYDGDARNFIFAPGSDYSPTDLFSDFKDVMPGDKLTQTVTVKNQNSKGMDVKIYIRALGAKENSEEFLSQLSLTVNQREKAKLFDAPADETAQLTDWVLLGTLHSGGKTDLDVTLNVPITLGNEFMDAVGYLDWQFKVEERPADNPDTGDTTVWVPYVIILISSMVGAIIILKANKKKAKR